MTKKEIIDILTYGDVEWSGDNCFKGLCIISKYVENIVIDAKNSIVYSISLDEAVENKISEKDIIELRKLNWMVDNDHLACFV